jgi:LysM repeat protein
LKSARELDARIAEKSISPYLQGGDEDHESPGTTARKVSDRLHSGQDPEVGDLPRLDTPDFFHSNDRPRGTDDRSFQELEPIPVPELGSDNTASSTQPERTAKNAAPAERTHVVQKGETLSSIAAKEMGSSSKFHELFEANRDQLNDANDVRVGMALKIPSRRTAKTEPATRTRERVNQAPPLLPSEPSGRDFEEPPTIRLEVDTSSPTHDASDLATPKKKFEPAKRPPLGVKSGGTHSTDIEVPGRTTRKLSQLPPGDSGGKVAR